MFSSNSVTVLTLIFRSLMNFCTWYEIGVQIHSFACRNPVVPASFVEETLLSPLNGLGTLVKKSIEYRCMGLFLDSQFYSIGLYVYPMPVPHCFDYCRLLVRFEIWKCESSNYFLIFKYCFGYLSPLNNSIWVWWSAFPFLKKKKAVGILMGIVLNLWIILGIIDILTILSLPTHEHGMAFPLFRSLISFSHVL